MVNRLISLIVLAALIALLPAPVHAEPVSAAIGLTSLLTAIGFSAAAAPIIGGAIISVGASLAINAAGAALQKASLKKAQKSQQAGLTSGVAAEVQGFRVPVSGGQVQRQLVFGETLKSGAIFFDEIRGPYWYLGLIVAAHEIEAFVEVRNGNEIVPINSAGFPIAAPYLNTGRTFFQMSFGLGGDDQEIDPILRSDFPELSDDFRQRGLARVVIKMYAGANDSELDSVWGRETPQWLFRIRGFKLADPRDSAISTENQLTYKYSRNAALCLARWVTHPDGGNQPWDNINLDYLMAAADVCDQRMPRADGTTEPRYSCDGIVLTGSEPTTVFEDMLLTMLGTITDINGQIAIIAGGPRSACMTLHDDSARGALNGATGRAWRDEVALVRTSFVSAERSYEVASGPVYADDGKIAAIGEEKSISVTLPFVTSVGQVQRICKHLIRRASLGRIIERTDDISAIVLTPGDIVQVWYSGDLASFNGLYEVAMTRQPERLDQVELTLLQYDANELYGWNPATDERDWYNQLYDEAA